MKKQHKTAISFALALIFALVSLPASALPRFEAKAEITPAWTVPEGYNAHDYTKCVTFLEQTDENGVKNGEKLSETYDPNDPETWGVNRDWTHLLMDGPAPDEPCFIWRSVNGEQRIRKINVGGKSLVGPLDISGCIDLVKLNCASCGLTELDLSSNTELGALRCSYNSLAELDLSNNTALGRLECDHNNLSELDISNTTHISRLSCHGNRLTELDLSNTNIHMNCYIMLKAEGNGYIGFDDYFYSLHQFGVYLYAYPANGVYGQNFEGFYRDSGELISHGWYSEAEGAYIYYDETSAKWPPDITVIARFSDELPYNAHDLEKCRSFLEQMDDHGYTNGEHINPCYNPDDPDTWRFYEGELCFDWIAVNGELRLNTVNLNGCSVWGMLDLSGCTELTSLSASNNRLTGLNFNGCTKLETVNCKKNNITNLWLNSFSALKELDCSDNEIDTINLFGCSALEKLDCSNNYIARLYVSDSPLLKTLECYSNNLIMLDVTGCSALEALDCAGNHLTFIDGISDCTALGYLYCSGNNLTELDVSGCTALEHLNCSANNIVELDVTQSTALEVLNCLDNNLTELDISNNTALVALFCRNNSIMELNVACNPLEYFDCTGNPMTELIPTGYMPFDIVQANGSGYIGYKYVMDGDYIGCITAKPCNGASFEGFYDETGALISEGEWSDYYEAYIYEFEGYPTGTIIARFSGGVTPGDIDGNGSVTVADAIMALRLAMGLLDGSGLNTVAADMDGNGSITIADAITILRTAMGLS